MNDYRRNNWSAYLYKVEDYGKKVTRVVDDSDVFGPVLSVLQDPVEPNLLWVGGEYGLYVSTNMAARSRNGTKTCQRYKSWTLPSKREKKTLS